MSSDVLAALKQIKKALSQGRDIGSATVGQMIQMVADGGELNPLPEPERAIRQPMKPMDVRRAKPKSTPAPEPKTVPDDVPEETEEDDKPDTGTD